MFDDLSTSMRLPSFNKFIKTHSHYKSKVIISSQSVKDIMPEARVNINFLILFKGIKNDLLETIYEDFKIKLEWNDFIDLYNDATHQRFSFLYIDTASNIYRRNFDTIYDLEV